MESLTANESGQPNKRKREDAEELLTASAKRIKVNTGDFLGEIVTLSKSNDDKERAKKFASSMSDLILETQTERRQIYFTDASLRSSCSAAIGVAWRTSDGRKRWDGEADELDLDYQNNVLAEIYAIEWAMDMAINEIRRTQTQAPKTECVFIFSDCLPALTGIKKAGLESADGWLVEGTEQLDLYQSILDYSLEFQAWGAQLELHWVPGHDGVEGNTIAHKIAYKEAFDIEDGWYNDDYYDDDYDSDDNDSDDNDDAYYPSWSWYY